MFSRSEKTEEVTEAMAEPAAQRSPMVLAALAGLLAIAGAFLLVWYLNTGSDEVAEDSPEAAAATAEASRQVLVVTQTIPRGTSVRELVEAPTVYLSARAVPEQFVAASAITSVAELQELDGLTLSSDALPGEQLLRGRFVDLSNFENESFLEQVTVVDAPAGHHQVVLALGSTAALGGNIRAGDEVTVIGGFRIPKPNSETNETVEISVVVLPVVEVVNVQASTEVAGQVASEANQVGVASRGSYTITVAVEPDELTDLTYAMQYGQITLAVALEGATNDDTPRAVTAIDHIVGDDGVWVAEREDGNLVDLLGDQDVEGSSIEIELPEDDDRPDIAEDESPVPADEESERPSETDDDASLVSDDESQPGDS